MFALKTYQTETLKVLKTYLEAARIIGAKPAFEQIEKSGVRDTRPYRPLKGLETVPYVCLRLPTGGGKTLLSAHTIKIAAEAYLEKEFPIVLWLVPTNTIRAQTLETLKKAGHPNNETLNAAFDGRFRVLDISDFTQITPADLETRACVIVATMQTLRVNNTDGRKVYAHNENLEPHFTSVSPNTAGLERQEENGNKGEIKFSFRNLLALHRPLVVVDEAHNNSSNLSYEVLERINAACVVEFTATPAADSNILHNVSATELKSEEMIKLPIRLMEHKSWEEAVNDSILTRQSLQAIAEKDSSYIRPIILFQAEERGQDVTKEVLLQYLVEQANTPREKIAVVTGDQKELDGINLFSPDCKIDYVITVEALKEGWDCSFAYVFCSVANVQSRKDVEQILGRVLRMPYAKRRKAEELNRAYAHVSRASWPNAVKQLHDRLVDMGFEDNEADSFIEKTPELELKGGDAGPLFRQEPPPMVFEFSENLANIEFSPEEASAVVIQKTEAGNTITFKGYVAEETVTRISEALPSTEAKENFLAAAKRHKAIWQNHLSPSQRGIPFRVPQLCFSFDGELELAEKETLLDFAGWNLTDYPAELSEGEFRLTETGVQWEIDLNLAGKIVERTVEEADQENLDLVDTGWTVPALCQWLEKKVRQADITQPIMLEFVRRAVSFLIDKRNIPITALVRWRFVLSKLLQQRIATHRQTASKSCYQQTLFAPQAAVEVSFNYAFDFAPNGYAPHWNYAGHPYEFKKHFYSSVGELKNSGEEYECAKVIDMAKQIKHWVRNLERRGFWLPLAEGKFYPDFVAELNDGRILVVEYKGADRITNDDSEEKNNIGKLWEARSNGKGIFLMATLKQGLPSLAEQIAGATAG